MCSRIYVQVLIFSMLVFCSFSRVHALNPCDPTSPYGFVELMETVDAQILSVQDETLDCLEKIRDKLEDIVNALGDSGGVFPAGLAKQPCGGSGNTPIAYGQPGNEVGDYVAGFTDTIETSQLIAKEFRQAFALVAKYKNMEELVKQQRLAIP